MQMDTKHVLADMTVKAGDEGSVTAVFSVFNIVDSDMDVVLPSAFRDGQQVPMVWSHDWNKIIGKGAVKVERDRALWDGKLFLNTRDGGEAFKTIKAMGDLMRYSWGYRVIESERGDVGGKRVRYIKRADLFEVSPVLVGANRDTYTVAVKRASLGTIDRQTLSELEWMAWRMGVGSKSTAQLVNDLLADNLALMARSNGVMV